MVTWIQVVYGWSVLLTSPIWDILLLRLMEWVPRLKFWWLCLASTGRPLWKLPSFIFHIIYPLLSYFPTKSVKTMGILFNMVYLRTADLYDPLVMAGKLFPHYSHYFITYSIWWGEYGPNGIFDPCVVALREGISSSPHIFFRTLGVRLENFLFLSYDMFWVFFFICWSFVNDGK